MSTTASSDCPWGETMGALAHSIEFPKLSSFRRDVASFLQNEHILVTVHSPAVAFVVCTHELKTHFTAKACIGIFIATFCIPMRTLVT